MEAIKVNLIPNGIPQTCHASQYDEGRQIRLDLFDGFTPYVIQSGDTFTLNVRKPDNHVITETVTGTEGNTYLVIETTEQMTAVMGKNLCEIRVENDGDNIGSLNFIMQVEKDVIANGIPSESVIEDLDALVAEAVAVDLANYYTKSEVDTALSNKADASTVSTLSNKVTELDGDVYGGFVPDYHDGFYAEYQGKALHNVNASWVYVVVDVSDFVGKTLTISTYADRMRKILFTDASDNVLDSVLIDTGNPNLYSTVTATVPTGTTKCYINKYASGQNDIAVVGYYQLKLALKTEVPMVDDEFGDNENATVSQKFITDNFANSIEAILPSSNSKIPIVDEDVPIYLDNLFRGVSPKELRLIDCNNVYIRIYDKTVAVLPSASNSGSSGIIKLHLVDDFKYEISAGVGFTKIEARTGSKKVLFIGDSITQNLSYLTPLKNLSDNGDYKLTFLGTLGTTIKHEGRQGWAAYNYANDSSALGATNAFWDGSKFNFAWYISQNSIEAPDYVFINLGTNDLIRGITDPSDDEEVKAVVTESYETMINSIRSYDANVPVVLWLPPTRCMCGRNNHTGIDNSLRINKILGDTFGYITYINNKVYLMHSYLFVNPYTDYTISDVTVNGVTYKDCAEPIHPTQDGGEKIAKGIMRQMMYIDGLLT